ncbi:Transposon Ty3-G Gag-Pol polyprotein [Pelomyxa schiedti]|nr:Transposon Ty3-G Gag-Pol polyprotein [Pelomyxa schiedti]
MPVLEARNPEGNSHQKKEKKGGTQPKSSGKILLQGRGRALQDILTNDRTKLGRTTLMEHHIPTKVCKAAARPGKKFTPKEEVVIGKEIQEMLRIDVIAPGKSEWVAPLSISQKKDGSMRLCTNKETLKDNYPLPNVFETLQELSVQHTRHDERFLAGAHFKRGHPQDRFGMANASQTFQQLMDKCLKGLIGKICLVYIDDIIIMGHSFEEHIQNIWEVLTRLRGANLKAKASKCKFFHHSVSYLGHTVSEKGIQMDKGRSRSSSTDASALGMGAALVQNDARGVEHIIELASRAGAVGEVLAAWSGTLGTGLEGWQAMQERDGDCCAIQAWLTRNELLPTKLRGLHRNEFVVRDGVLFHINAVKKKIKLCQALVCHLRPRRQRQPTASGHEEGQEIHLSCHDQSIFRDVELKATKSANTKTTVRMLARRW